MASKLLDISIKMKFLKSVFLFVSIFIGLLNGAKADIISPSGQELSVTFAASVFVPNGVLDNDYAIEAAIKLQLHHLVGAFQSPQFAASIGEKNIEDTGVIAVGPLASYSIQSREVVGTGVEVKYLASIEALTQKDFATFDTQGHPRSIALILPHNPYSVYSTACVSKDLTDRYSFFYNWNPYLPTCVKAEKAKNNNLDRVQALVSSVKPLPNDLKPNYEKILSQAKTRDGEIRIATLLGYYEPNTIDRDSRDNFNAIYKQLTKSEHFVQVANLANTDLFASPAKDKQPYVELLRPATAVSPPIRLWLSLSFTKGPSPKVYASRARFAIEKADIVTYWGHSGLGRYLDFDWLSQQDEAGPIKMSGLYQIFFLQGCESFLHYSVPFSASGKSAVVT